MARGRRSAVHGDDRPTCSKRTVAQKCGKEVSYSSSSSDDETREYKTVEDSELLTASDLEHFDRDTPSPFVNDAELVEEIYDYFQKFGGWTFVKTSPEVVRAIINEEVELFSTSAQKRRKLDQGESASCRDDEDDEDERDRQRLEKRRLADLCRFEKNLPRDSEGTPIGFPCRLKGFEASEFKFWHMTRIDLVSMLRHLRVGVEGGSPIDGMNAVSAFFLKFRESVHGRYPLRLVWNCICQHPYFPLMVYSPMLKCGEIITPMDIYRKGEHRQDLSNMNDEIDSVMNSITRADYNRCFEVPSSISAFVFCWFEKASILPLDIVKVISKHMQPRPGIVKPLTNEQTLRWLSLIKESVELSKGQAGRLPVF